MATKDEFLAEIISVCKKHNMSISHEDEHGLFRVVDYDESCTDWLMHAEDKREQPRKNPIVLSELK